MNAFFVKTLLRIRPVELAEFVKKMARVSRVEAQIGNQHLWLDPASNLGSQLLLGGAYEKDFTERLTRILRPGDVFLDVGANEGYFSLLASEKVGENGHVYIMEPQARLWQVILFNFLLNRRVNYTLIPYAAGDTEGFFELILHPSLNTGSSTLVDDARRRLMPRQKAGGMPLDTVVRKFGISKVRLLKIDVEGYELFVLRGAHMLLHSKQVDHILLEFHPAQLARLGHSRGEIEQLLTESGYRKISAGGFEHWQRLGIVE